MKNSQIVNTVCIVVGGGLLIYSIASSAPNKYLQIIGFIVIMFGLYRATNFWVETKDDHKENPEEKEEGR